jgi:hypothetical protein
LNSTSSSPTRSVLRAISVKTRERPNWKLSLQRMFSFQTKKLQLESKLTIRAAGCLWRESISRLSKNCILGSVLGCPSQSQAKNTVKASKSTQKTKMYILMKTTSFLIDSSRSTYPRWRPKTKKERQKKLGILKLRSKELTQRSN